MGNRKKICTILFIAVNNINVCTAEVLDTTTSGASRDTHDIQFNNSFLMGDAQNMDLSRFSEGNVAVAGIHPTDLYVNGKLLQNQPLEFPDNGKGVGFPCLTKNILEGLGIDTTKMSLSPEEKCVALDKHIAEASINYDSNALRLDIQVPQLYVKEMPNGYIDPSRWDHGINAGFASWNWNTWYADNHGNADNSLFAGLDYGINLDDWRFRANGSFNKSSEQTLTYSSNQAYAQRQLSTLDAQLVVGDTYTKSDIFDSVNLRGVRLYNDGRMKPGGNAAYLPVIHGTAKTNAKVTVRQGDAIIFQTVVTPGMFELKDIGVAFNGSDLDVTVEETDGSRQHFSVPFSTVTQLLKEGNSTWEFGMGKDNRTDIIDAPQVVLGTYSRGLTNVFTGYTGFEFTDSDYTASLLGVAANTEVGALAVDVTHSEASLPDDENRKGESYRISYNKVLNETLTSFNIAAWRYSTKNYLSLDDAVTLREQMQSSHADDRDVLKTVKNKYMLNVNQPLEFGEQNYGSVYVSGNWSTYWGGDSSTVDYSFGYSNSFSYGSYSITAQRTYQDDDTHNDQIGISVSIPLENLLPGGRELHHDFSYVNMAYNSDLKGNSQVNTTASGSSADNLFSYSVTGSTQHQTNAQNQLSQVSGSLGYNSAYGAFSSTISSSAQGEHQLSFGGNGGLLVHPDGYLFLDRNIGESESFSILEAQGAEGSGTDGVGGIINKDGFGISNSLTPYQDNQVFLNIASMDQDVEVESTSASVVPTDGAITLVKFKTKTGQSYVIPLQIANEETAPPMGSEIYDMSNNLVGVMGQGEMAYVRGVPQAGKLLVKWGVGAKQQCLVDYSIKDGNQLHSRTVLLPQELCRFS